LFSKYLVEVKYSVAGDTNTGKFLKQFKKYINPLDENFINVQKKLVVLFIKQFTKGGSVDQSVLKTLQQNKEIKVIIITDFKQIKKLYWYARFSISKQKLYRIEWIRRKNSISSSKKKQWSQKNADEDGVEFEIVNSKTGFLISFSVYDKNEFLNTFKFNNNEYGYIIQINWSSKMSHEDIDNFIRIEDYVNLNEE